MLQIAMTEDCTSFVEERVDLINHIKADCFSDPRNYDLDHHEDEAEGQITFDF